MQQRRLRVLILPSWFPKGKTDTHGIFIKEQVNALRENPLLDVKAFDCSIRIPIIPLNIQIHFLVQLIRANLFLSKWQPDIIHAHVAYPAGVVAQRLKSHLGCPIVLTEHTGPLSLLRSYFSSQEDFSKHFLKYDGILTVSGFLKDELIAINPHLKIHILGNIVSNHFLETPLSNCKIRNHGIFIGRFTKEKGIKQLMSVLTIYDKLYSSYPLTITCIGGGPMESDLRTLCGELKNIELRIVPPTHERAVLAEHFAKASFLLLTSEHETFSLVAAESLACGKPVIGFQCGGPSEFIKGNNGLLIETRDPTTLAELVLQTAHGTKFDFSREAMASRRKFIQDQYSKEFVTEELYRFYLKFCRS